MKNILYVHNGNKIGGGERSLLALFTGIDRQAYKILIACPDKTPFADALRNLEVEIVPFQFSSLKNVFRLLVNIHKLKNIIVSKKIAIVHSNSPQTNFPSAFAAKACNIPVIWHERVLLEQGMVDIDKIFSFLPDKIICNSEAIRKRFQGIKDYASRTMTVTNGVDTDAFSPEFRLKEDQRARLGIPQEAKVIGVFDRLDPVKNHEVILEAFSILHDKYPCALLLIAGEAFCQAEQRLGHLKRRAEYLGINDVIRFEGHQKDIRPLMTVCDVVVQASLSEGCSRVICEAQAMGKPIVASDVGGNPEILKEGHTGFLCEASNVERFADKLLFLLTDDALRNRMEKNARLWAVKNLSLEHYCGKIQRIYQNLSVTNNPLPKKVLVVSYDYLPRPHAASYMVQSRAKYLMDYGWEPVVLTRHWDKGHVDACRSVDGPVRKERDPNAGFSVYRTSYKQFLEQIFNIQKKFSSKNIIFKVMNFFLRNFCFYPDEYRGWHKTAVQSGIEVIKKENISAILSVGSPWTDHLVSRDLSQATGLKWIAAYMDPWTQTSNEDKWKKNISWKWGMRSLISRMIEKKICSQACCAIHNSEPWALALEKILKIHVHSIPHGIDPFEFHGITGIKQNGAVLTLTYVGSLHFTQNTQVFFDGLARFLEGNTIPEDKLRLRFIGCNGVQNRYAKYTRITKYIENLPYMHREDAKRYLMEAHILLLFLMEDDGWYPMKCFEYLNTRAQILATPSDQGVIQSLLHDSHKGVALDRPDQVASWLKDQWVAFCQYGELPCQINHEPLKGLDRKQNVQKLGKILDSMVGA